MTDKPATPLIKPPFTSAQVFAALDATDRWRDGLLSSDEAIDLLVRNGGFTHDQATAHLKKWSELDD